MPTKKNSLTIYTGKLRESAIGDILALVNDDNHVCVIGKETDVSRLKGKYNNVFVVDVNERDYQKYPRADKYLTTVLIPAIDDPHAFSFCNNPNILLWFQFDVEPRLVSIHNIENIHLLDDKFYYSVIENIVQGGKTWSEKNGMLVRDLPYRPMPHYPLTSASQGYGRKSASASHGRQSALATQGYGRKSTSASQGYTQQSSRL